MPLLSKELKQGGFSTSATAGNYLSLKAVDGKHKTRFTILGDDSLTGWECWVLGPNGKQMPLRFADKPTQSDIEERCSEAGGKVKGPEYDQPTEAKRFMAFAVWTYNASVDDKDNEIGKVQVLQFSQATIANPLIAYLSDEEIEAEPHIYDFVLSATVGAQPVDKRFSIAALPGRRRKAEVNKEVEAAWEAVQGEGFDLQRLLSNADPFKSPF